MTLVTAKAAAHLMETATVLTLPPPGTCLILSFEPHLDWTLLRSSFLLIICTLPPPGWCFRFSVEPIFDLTFFRSGMGTGAVCRRLLLADGDLGGVRTTATFLGSRVGGVGRDGVRERLPGVPGEPGLL